MKALLIKGQCIYLYKYKIRNALDLLSEIELNNLFKHFINFIIKFILNL